MKPFYLLLAAALSFPAVAKTHAHWSYRGKESPEHWGELSKEFAVCGQGKNQSPVDFEKTAGKTRGGLVDFHFRAGHYTVENNGHTVQAVPQGKAQRLYIDGKTFTFKQLHFHTPSEHTFKHRHFPMEAHFVYQTAQGELAVLGVMFREGKANAVLDGLLAKKLAAGESAQTAKPLDISALFPKQRTHFRLNGSLTTPPCSEGVNWVVFETPVQASEAQIKLMTEIIGGPNNRPVQPINSRIVIEEAE